MLILNTTVVYSTEKIGYQSHHDKVLCSTEQDLIKAIQSSVKDWDKAVGFAFVVTRNPRS